MISYEWNKRSVTYCWKWKKALSNWNAVGYNMEQVQIQFLWQMASVSDQSLGILGQFVNILAIETLYSRAKFLPK